VADNKPLPVHQSINVQHVTVINLDLISLACCVRTQFMRLSLIFGFTGPL